MEPVGKITLKIVDFIKQNPEFRKNRKGLIEKMGLGDSIWTRIAVDEAYIIINRYKYK